MICILQATVSAELGLGRALPVDRYAPTHEYRCAKDLQRGLIVKRRNQCLLQSRHNIVGVDSRGTCFLRKEVYPWAIYSYLFFL
jgi:hypothetical protein